MSDNNSHNNYNQTNSTMLDMHSRCYHCSEPTESGVVSDDHVFCCVGCASMYSLLKENNLCSYYTISEGQRFSFKQYDRINGQYSILDNPNITEYFTTYRQDEYSIVEFTLPTMHCASCIWLLEHLYSFNPSILRSDVTFDTKRISITIDKDASLASIADILSKLGYPPEISVETDKNIRLDEEKTQSTHRDLYKKLGVAGFTFANAMLLSAPEYLAEFHHNDLSTESLLVDVFRFGGLALASVSVFYSASDYFKQSYYALSNKRISIDVPIAIGVSTLYIRSCVEIFSGSGTGYTDTCTGLIFFLLIAKVLQLKAFNTLSFARSYSSFFALSSTVIDADGNEHSEPISQIPVGSTIRVRNGEIIPMDSQLLSANAMIDYSFITGEETPVHKVSSDMLYAGGKVLGQPILSSTRKESSQSYLTELWNNPRHQTTTESTYNQISEQFSLWFVLLTITIAVASGLYWLPDVTRSINTFSAVLIVACPCALTLAAPFAWSVAMSKLGAHKFYVKNIFTVSDIASIDTILVDKTGTLTTADSSSVQYSGEELSSIIIDSIAHCVAQSSHPLCNALHGALTSRSVNNLPLSDDTQTESTAFVSHNFNEIIGKGISAEYNTVDGKNYSMTIGSLEWLSDNRVHGEETDSLNLHTIADSIDSPLQKGSLYVAVNSVLLGVFSIHQQFRTGVLDSLSNWTNKYEVYVVSGDTAEAPREILSILPKSHVLMGYTPEMKYRLADQLSKSGKHVAMIGDGLNDGLAFRSSVVGVACQERTSQFTPASSVIMHASMIKNFGNIIDYAKRTNVIIKATFLLSIIFNIIGLSVAVSGNFTPVFAALFMPLSSWTVVAISYGFMSLLPLEYKLDSLDAVSDKPNSTIFTRLNNFLFEHGAQDHKTESNTIIGGRQ